MNITINLFEKACSTCKQVKPFEEFNRASNSPTGYRSNCRDCKNSARKSSQREKIYRKYEKFMRRDKVANGAAIQRDGLTCSYCSISLSIDEVEVDHVIPLSKRGAHVMDNLAVSCHDCNHVKHAKSLETFSEQMGEAWKPSAHIQHIMSVDEDELTRVGVMLTELHFTLLQEEAKLAVLESRPMRWIEPDPKALARALQDQLNAMLKRIRAKYDNKATVAA